VKTWLLVAAERREFDGLRKRLTRTAEMRGLNVKFACEGTHHGERWVMIANGPGRELATLAVSDAIVREVRPENIAGIISAGYCGALDPMLKVGDIIVSNETHLFSDDTRFSSNRAFARGGVVTQDRVAVTAAEKRTLRKKTGAIAVDMEADAIQNKAQELGVRYGCIRVVSDAAGEDLPLDFNQYRNADGNFSRLRIALAAMARPFSVMPALMEFDRRSKQASLALGDFLADCRF
jgi:adenosylhomocysteine nucleosidase